MSKHLIALTSSFCLFSVLPAQEAPSPLLIHAAQCLEAKSFLPLSKSPERSFGYFLDSTSYPNQDVLYVVEFANSSTSRGWVFTIFLSNSRPQVFDIQNNARFIPSKKGIGGIDFPDPPLGGTGTQENIVSAIKRIQQSTRYTLPEKDLQITPSDARCESYVDSR